MKFFKDVFKKHQKITLVVFGSVLAICTIYIYFLVQILINDSIKAFTYADAIIVLGHAINENNEPSPWLYERLNGAIYLYNAGFANRLIVTGGQGPLDDMPVAYAMRHFLVYNGINIESILVEASSRDTFENFSYSKIIAKKNDISSIIFVTNNFHIFRSLNMAKLFFEDVQAHSAYASNGISLTIAYLREPVSIIYNNLRRIIWKF
ncbi:MAG: YdcF family protein [Defluviitaleaceae bacterium]|nr:YdcF family protein [Defluviitaleaceae bacterium]